MVITNAISILALLLSVLTFVVSQRMTRLNSRLSYTPVLVFVYAGRSWHLQNVGNGPALNVVVASKRDLLDEEWVHPTRIPPIATGGDFLLSWLDDEATAALAATYEDFLSVNSPGRAHVYTVSATHDVNRVVPRRDLPAWDVTESAAHWERGNGTGRTSPSRKTRT